MQGDSYVYRQILVKSISLVSWEELSWRKVPVFSVAGMAMQGSCMSVCCARASPNP